MPFHISGQQCHTTRDSLAQGGEYAPCALPFKFNGELRDACITDLDPDGKYWCSTNVNPRTRQHVGGGGFWGYCEDSCPPINAKSTKTTTDTTTTKNTRDFGSKVRISHQSLKK